MMSHNDVEFVAPAAVVPEDPVTAANPPGVCRVCAWGGGEGGG